jgi:hypothetical protein
VLTRYDGIDAVEERTTVDLTADVLDEHLLQPGWSPGREFPGHHE